MNIRILKEDTVNQIAAGEVIERPLNIVKELVENSVDAGASSISVEIRDGGMSLIRVTDNGCGIQGTEVATAFLRHATSKLSDVRDLNSIRTFGFRGEALSSIASVAKVEIITKTPGSLFATHYSISGGVEEDCSEIGAPEGTTLIVRDLFFNVPARKKFMMSKQLEGSRIQEVLEKEALSHPELSFRFLADGRMRMHTLGNGSLMDVIFSIYGKDTAAMLIPVNFTKTSSASDLYSFGKIHVHGFIGKPVTNRSNRNYETFFVNTRFVKDPIIVKAVEDAFKPYLMQHKFPFAVLSVDIDPEQVDVNVHPQKMEVRFQNGEAVYKSVYEGVTKALQEQELIVEAAELEELDLDSPKNAGIPDCTPGTDGRKAAESSDNITDKAQRSVYDLHVEPFETKRDKQLSNVLREQSFEEKYNSIKHDPVKQESDKQDAVEQDSFKQESNKQGFLKQESDKQGFLKQDFIKQDAIKQESLFTERFLSEKARFQHRILGQAFGTYWIVEYGDSLYMIDQHAAHEKVLFERIMKRFKERENEKSMISQNLLPPIILTLSSGEILLIEKYEDFFQDLGFQFSFLGGKELSLYAVPVDLSDIGKKELFLEMLDSLSEEVSEVRELPPESIYDKIATMSCKAAVKGMHDMDIREADALIGELLSLDNPYSCPHGRPTIFKMTKYEIEKKFKRVV